VAKIKLELNRILQIIKSKKVLFKNFTSLSLLQIANYVFPLITLPYLVRVLGPEKYGLVNFASSFVAYFAILTDYGFNLTATQDISVNINDDKKVSTIFSSVIIIKLFFFLASSFLFVIVILIFPQFQDEPMLYIFSFIGILGPTIFPIWLFQATEKMHFILIVNVVVRTVLTVLIFTLIISENDFLLFVVLSAIANLVVGIIGFILAVVRLNIKLVLPTTLQLKEQIVNGWDLFLSTLWINLYTTSNVFILGLFAPLNVVGYYAAADKVRMAFQGILSPITQSVFPYVNKLLSESYDHFISFNRKLLKIGLMLGLLISLFLFVFAPEIVFVLLGKKYLESVILLRILSIIPLVIIISNVLGFQTMLPLKMKKQFSFILFTAMFINIVLQLILIPILNSVGTAISIVITEITVALIMLVYLKKRKIIFSH